MDLTVPHAMYVSILRNPVAQLESAFTYFKLFEGLNISGTDKFGVFLSDPHKYFNTSQHDLLRNGQLHDLGFDHDHENLTKIRKKVDEVSKTIDLMMITEYYDESLILLKRLLCWEFEDIMYLPKGVRIETNRYDIPPNIAARARKWNAGDVML